MRKFLILLIASLFQAGMASAQQKYIAKNAYISFYSKTPMEDILGESNEAVTFLDSGNGEIVFAVLINTFHFKRALMEEHFNENYMESAKFPKAKFKGTIVDFKPDQLKSPTSGVRISGVLNIHGKDKTIDVPAKIGLENGKVTATSTFKVTPEDFGIEIPNLVRDKIAKELDITVKTVYEPYNP